ncbi:hypothetical protein TARUN_6428 [Trichoderma arundinaceum]|uniref:Uncharacterized protein n=1 Tax=Trichoderma arundinaceum TaxID=490622 RepID=A0A395NJ14_TRIAR|nr:hypothetical protein TARUN_6428 [Trichoderma arundinaceum]
MHNEAWTLLRRLKEGFKGILRGGAYPDTPDDLPFVAGLVFAVAAGQMSPQGDKKVEDSDVLMHAAVAIMRKFLEEGKGSAIKQAATKTLQMKDVEGLEFESNDPWGIEKLNQVSHFP